MKERDFIENIQNYYKFHKRSFPWRETDNPYFIFLSEIMLQQTQTSRVIEKYLEFTTVFPTVNALSKASFSTVLSHWSGLGYNRRAKYLHESAKLIANKYKGIFPKDVQLLDELPGVGINTAAAIVVYSFNIPQVFIETNIRRIYIHHFFEGVDNVHDKDLLPLIEQTLDRENPREWYWALMDYGTALPKAIINPNRKSAHYIKQSKFEGSVRQVRGSILRILLANGKLSIEEIGKQLMGDHIYLTTALGQLVNERLILKNDELYEIQ